MSKSPKKKPTPVPGKPQSSIPVPERRTTNEAVKSKVEEVKEPQGFELIRFDKRVKWTLGVFVGFFLLCVLLKWHFVSLPIWNTLLPDGAPANRGLITGTPKQIRMDDYAMATPWIISNYNNEFTAENEAVGGLKAPMLILPVMHPVILFKFLNWGFIFLDVERGYAWMYDSGPLILLIGAFLFLLLISKNNYFLSLTGALTLLLSSGTVRWAFIPSPMIGYCCLAVVLAVSLLKATKPVAIGILSILLIWVVISYILILYPPYQLPMGYLFIMVLIGYIINERQSIFPIKALPTKLLSLLGVSGLAVAILFIFYSDVHETLTAVTSTVYPGQRSETGGTGFVANAFSEYYSWFFDDQKLPKTWLNICELSHYLNFAPTIIPLALGLFIVNKKVDWMLALSSLFIIVMWIWMEVGFPKFLAQISLMSMVPTRRAQIPMGVGNIVLLFLYLNALTRQENLKTKQIPVWVTSLFIIWIVSFVIYTAYINVNDSDGLLKLFQLFIPILFFIAMNSLLLFSIKIPYRTSIFFVGLLVFLFPNIKANPLSFGLSPITDHSLYKTVRDLVEKDPAARWMVNGNQFITYMVTATGAKQITGVKYIPDRKHIMNVLDPQMKRDSAYNRYAHVTYQSFIDGKDSVVLFNQFEDGYVIAMDPCSPRMKKLNVKYQIFDHQPQPYEVRCMKSITTLGSLTIYQSTN